MEAASVNRPKKAASRPTRGRAEKGRAYLVDVGIQQLPFPIRVRSRKDPAGQPTVANIAIKARIASEFEARWIDRFIQIVHKHRDNIGPATVRHNIMDYVSELHANSVRVDMAYPYFVEKRTPVSNEPCLVRYNCCYSGQYPALDGGSRIILKIECPVITTYPVTLAEGRHARTLPQLSIVELEVETDKDTYVEDLVELVDSHGLAPIYSFLTEDDQRAIIERTQTELQYSVDLADEIREALARNPDVRWYSVRCSNLGMLHNYTTVIGTEKSFWVPGSYYDAGDV